MGVLKFERPTVDALKNLNKNLSTKKIKSKVANDKKTNLTAKNCL